MINREALEYLVDLGEEKDPILELEQGTFSIKGLDRVTKPLAAKLEIATLTGMIDYIKTNADNLQGSLLIHVDSPREVNLYSTLNEDRRRELYVRANALLPNNIYYDRFIGTEEFNIMLQSSFVDAGDKEVLLKYTGLIKDEAVKSTGDDGVSQAVTIKTGVASVGQAVVPNPVTLAPYRTFPEIEQPLSKFIFRMQQGPKAALYEADGGAWRNQAMRSIKAYLEEELKEMKNINIIS
ncbi:hypothetical protein FDC02_04930 [Clostridium botulinum]|nr:hypothetical protein [Clostridium botulinum]